jgi:hypothetical protein
VLDDTTTVTDTSLEAEATAGSPEPEAMDPAKVIDSYKRRQAGAEAARQAAEAKANAALAELEALRAKSRTTEDQETADLATLREQLRIATEKAAQADARVATAQLDAKFPNARKELPEVTDEVRLAKFEAMLRDEDYEPPTPGTPNAPKGSDQRTKQRERTKDDVLADLSTITEDSLGWFR